VATINKKQERIATGLRLNKEGLAEVKKLALKLSHDIAAGVAPEKKDVAVLPTIAEAIAKFKADWDSKYSGVKRQVTWEKDYQAVFSRLPQNALLSPELLLERPLR
jgi:hypothetical protein